LVNPLCTTHAWRHSRCQSCVGGPHLGNHAPEWRFRPRVRTFSFPAFLRHQPGALPLSAGQDRTEGVHGTQRQQCGRTQRRAGPNRFSPQPVGRLSAELRRLCGLRVGARLRRRIPAEPVAKAHAAPQPRSCRHGLQALGDGGAICAAAVLSGFAPSRRRHGRHGRAGFRRHGRADARRQLYDRISRTRRRRWTPRAAGRMLPDGPAGRRTVDDLQLLRRASSAARGAGHLHHRRPCAARGAGGAALCLSRLLDRGVRAHGL